MTTTAPTDAFAMPEIELPIDDDLRDAPALRADTAAALDAGELTDDDGVDGPFDARIDAAIAEDAAAAQAPAQAPESDADAEPVSLLQLPPSLLVIMEVGTPGAVRWRRLDEAVEQRQQEDGTRDIETTRTSQKLVHNADEYTRCRALASKLRAAPRKLGRVLQSGVLLVPLANEAGLDDVIRESRAAAAEHNATARHHFVRFSIVKASITTDAEATAREVAWSIREMVTGLKGALQQADVKRVREIALQAKTFGKVLGDSDSKLLADAVKAARKAATYINREAGSKGRLIDDVKSEIDLSAIEQARVAFLQYEVPAEMTSTPVGVSLERFTGEPEPEPAAPVEAPAVTVDEGRFADL